VTANIDKTSGDDELVITLEDNGHGMDEEGLKAFLDLVFQHDVRKTSMAGKLR
jgi:hypothetical protein